MCEADQLTRTFRDALAAATGGLSWLAAMDVTSLTTAEQADCLRALERAESQAIAARAAVLAAFDSSCGYEDDGAGGPRSWLRWQTRVTTGAAAGAVGWMRRLSDHPDLAAAMASGDISASWARQFCDWTDRLPEDGRAGADEILLEAAAGGVELSDLGRLAEEMRIRTARPDIDGDDDGFSERSVRLHTHFRGTGKLDGDLTPECSVALRAVLDALGTKAGPEDLRSPGQRDHDALAEACRRLIAAGGLPDRAGQPTQIQLHMSLEQLLGLDGADQVLAEWGGRGTAGPGDDCDASIVPIVTGHVDADLLSELAAELVSPGSAPATLPGTARAPGTATIDMTLVPETAAMAQTAARELLLTRATRLLSGPAGLAAHLRGALLPQPAASISIPLDIGRPTEIVSPQLRKAIIARDKHCSFPGCHQRPAACQVHHLIARSKGGTTSLDNCCLLCAFHHLIAIHRWGWKLRLHPDGTTTAVSPNGSKTRHSHALPVQAA